MSRSIEQRLARGEHFTVSGMAKGLIFPKQEKGNTPENTEDAKSFKDRPEDEQKSLMLEVTELVAEQRDLARGKLEKKTAEREAKESGQVAVISYETVRVGTRFVRRMKKTSAKGKEVKAEDVALEQRSREATENRLKEINQELGRLGGIPGLREAYGVKTAKMWFLIESAKQWQESRHRKAELQGMIDQIMLDAKASGAGVLAGEDLMRVRTLKEEMKEVEKGIEKFETYDAGNELRRLIQLREYAEMLSTGRIVEIPSVERIISEGLENLRARRAFLLAGHLGSGKTEMAKHLARLYMMETHPDVKYEALEPEFFSGSDESSVYDLVGKLKIVGRDAGDPAILTDRVGKLSEALEKAKIKDVPKDELAKILFGKGDITETMFNYGPLGRAIKRGVPIIIDEINMVPPEVLSRINDILLRRVGDKVRLQENGEEEFEIAPGFVVISTCNLGSQYSGIKEVNAAFKSRWVSKEVAYPPLEETFDLALASLLRKDRVRLPPSFQAEQFDRIADLAVVASEVQDIFTGRGKATRFMVGTSGIPERAQLKGAVISTRDLLRKIIEPWKDGGFSESLDDIVAKNIVASEVFSEKDQKLLAEIFIRRGFFQGWDQKRFERAGIRTIVQDELNALQATQQTPAYINENKAINDLLAQAHGRSALIRESLLIGTEAPEPRRTSKAA